MGNEMECVCDRCVDDHVNSGKEDTDMSFIALSTNIDSKKAMMKESFVSTFDVIYSYISEQNSLSVKALLIKSSLLENFFLSKGNLFNYSKLEVNYYYNQIIISNFLGKAGISFILLQDIKNVLNEDISMSFSHRHHMPIASKAKKKEGKSSYKVEKMNMMSLNKAKITEQLLNDLHLKLAKNFVFNGMIPTPEEYDDMAKRESFNTNKSGFYNNKHVSKSFFESTSKRNDYLVLYKRIKNNDSTSFNYYIDSLQEKLSTNNITQMLFKHQNDKELISVVPIEISIPKLVKSNNNTNETKEIYLFIFKQFKNRNITPLDDDSFNYFVVDFTLGKSTSETFIKDICDKVASESKATLVTVVNAITKFYLIFKLDLDNIES